MGLLLPPHCQITKLQNLSQPPNSPDLNPFDYSMWEYKVYKTRITDLDELKQRLRMEWTKLDYIVIVAGFVNGVVDSCRSVMHVLYSSLHSKGQIQYNAHLLERLFHVASIMSLITMVQCTVGSKSAYQTFCERTVINAHGD